MNDRGQPVIHDIASKLGCIRPSPDLPYSFPEQESDFVDLQARMKMEPSHLKLEEVGDRKPSTDDSSCSPSLDRADRASSTESDHSTFSNQRLLAQRRQASAGSTMTRKSMPASILTNINDFAPPSYDGETPWPSHTPIYTPHSIPSPAYTDYQTPSPFSWVGTDDVLTPEHPLAYSTQMMPQQMLRPSPLAHNYPMSLDINQKMTSGDALPGIFGDGTVRPNMLSCNTNGINTSEYDPPLVQMEYTLDPCWLSGQSAMV
jgi:hypothetical protein